MQAATGFPLGVTRRDTHDAAASTEEQLAIIRRLDPHGMRATVIKGNPSAFAAARPGQGLVSDPLNTILCQRLGCRYPMIQTAMGWVARPELVAATCNAGGFGFLAAAVMSAEEVGPAIDRVRSMTAAPFGVNFHMFQPGAERIVDLIIDEKVTAVSFGRGPDQQDDCAASVMRGSPAFPRWAR